MLYVCDYIIRLDEVLAELQFSFVCFLVGQHYDSFEHWKHLLVLFLQCDGSILRYPDFYSKLISDLHFQVVTTDLIHKDIV